MILFIFTQSNALYALQHPVFDSAPNLFVWISLPPVPRINFCMVIFVVLDFVNFVSFKRLKPK